MTRDEKITLARELRARGLTYRAIGAQLGVGIDSVYRWCNPDYAARNRALCRANKARKCEQMRAADRRRWNGTQCLRCGTVTGAIDDVGDPCCPTCKRADRTVVAVATCDRCRARLLEPAPLCGLCVEELALKRRGRVAA